MEKRSGLSEVISEDSPSRIRVTNVKGEGAGGGGSEGATVRAETVRQRSRADSTSQLVKSPRREQARRDKDE